MSTKSLITLAAAGLACAALANGNASATVVPVGNGTFSSTTTTSYQVALGAAAATPPANDFITPSADTVMPSWGVVMQSVNTPGTPNYWSSGNQTVANGNLSSGTGTNPQVAFVNGGQNLIYQDLGPVSANTTYTLTVGVGSPGSGYGSGAADAALIALVNGTVDTSTATAALPTIDPANELTVTTGTSLGAMQAETVTLATGATVSGDLTVLLENVTPQFSSGTTVQESQISFGNVQVNASPVPEPTPLALLAVAAGALCLLHRRRRSAAC